jgi:hypothetical protein
VSDKIVADGKGIQFKPAEGDNRNPFFAIANIKEAVMDQTSVPAHQQPIVYE